MSEELSGALARTGAARASALVVDADGVVEVAGDPDERFALASVTKLLTAYAVLIATEERTVDLDEEIGPPGATLRHLLAHASGLGMENRDRIAAAPGRFRVYSNAGIELAAALVAERAAIPFATYLDEAVLRPLGMGATTLAGSPARAAVASAGDLGRFARELLAPTLLSAATLRDATAVAFPGLVGVLPGFGRMSPCDWGLGFELRDHKRPHWTGELCSPESFGHFGQSGTCLVVDPVAGLGVVVLTDRPFGDAAKSSWPPLIDGAITRHRGAPAVAGTLPPMPPTRIPGR